MEVRKTVKFLDAFFGWVVLPVVMAGLPAVAAAQTLEWSAGALGGGWFAVATGLARVITERHPEIRITLVRGGSLDNARRVQMGASQIGMAIDFLAAAALKGEEPFRGDPQANLRSLGTGWYPPSLLHVVGPADGPPDLKTLLAAPGLRIGTTPRGTSEELTLRQILAFYGSSIDAIQARGGRFVTASFSELARTFAEGRIDALFGAGALPAPWVPAIARGPRPPRLVAFPQDLMRHITSQLGYRAGTIPEGAYPRLQAGAVPVASTDTVLLVSANLPEALAYRLTKTLLEGRDRFAGIHQGLTSFDASKAGRDQPVPLHPGAERAYREMGFL